MSLPPSVLSRPSPSRLLARLHGWEAKRFGSQALREPMFLLAVALLLAAAATGLRAGFAWEPSSVMSRLVIEAGAAVAALLGIGCAVSTWADRRLDQGPFHAWIASRTTLRSWRIAMTGALYGTAVIFAALVLLTLDARRMGGLLVAAAVGSAVGAAGLSLLPPPAAASRAGDTSVGPERRSAAGRRTLLGVQARRRIGAVPAWVVTVVLFVVGGLGTALALRNNASPTPGLGLLAVTGLLGGATVGQVDLLLVAMLGRAPIGLARLVRDLVLPPAFATVILTGVAGVAAGAPPGLACGVAAAVGAALAVHAAAVVLHALGGSPRFAGVAAGVDIALLALITLVFPPLLLAWAPWRIVRLVGDARRLRWRDR